MYMGGHMKLVQLWHYEVGDEIYDLAFSDSDDPFPALKGEVFTAGV